MEIGKPASCNILFWKHSVCIIRSVPKGIFEVASFIILSFVTKLHLSQLLGTSTSALFCRIAVSNLWLRQKYSICKGEFSPLLKIHIHKPNLPANCCKYWSTFYWSRSDSSFTQFLPNRVQSKTYRI